MLARPHRLAGGRRVALIRLLDQLLYMPQRGVQPTGQAELVVLGGVLDGERDPVGPLGRAPHGCVVRPAPWIGSPASWACQQWTNQEHSGVHCTRPAQVSWPAQLLARDGGHSVPAPNCCAGRWLTLFKLSCACTGEAWGPLRGHQAAAVMCAGPLHALEARLEAQRLLCTVMARPLPLLQAQQRPPCPPSLPCSQAPLVPQPGCSQHARRS